MIGFLEEINFEFPRKFELGLRLKDILESEVEEKFYLNKSWKFSKDSDNKHDVNEIAQIKSINYKATRSITDSNKICRCLDTMSGGQREPKILVTDSLRIRKLTPKECWRLMGIKDSDFKKAQKLNSNSQLYKQAGNGIVVDVLEYIFKEIEKI